MSHYSLTSTEWVIFNKQSIRLHTCVIPDILDASEAIKAGTVGKPSCSNNDEK